MRIFTEIQTRILEALAHYRYLTHSQMLRLKIGSASFLRYSTRRLREKGAEPYIASIRYPFHPRQGRLEQVHHLTPAGAAVLAEIKRDDRLRAFKPVTSVYHRDYWHRKHTIDFQIALEQAIVRDGRLEVHVFDRYFDKSGANRSDPSRTPLRSSTRIDLDSEEHVIPDANIVLGSNRGKRSLLYTVEVANGQDTGRNLKQIERHARLLERRALSARYEDEGKMVHQVLFILEDYSMLTALRKRFVEVEAAHPYSACYRFGYLPYLLKDPIRCWQLPSHVSDAWHHLISGQPAQLTEEETGEAPQSIS